MPAYNAEKTLKQTYSEIYHDFVDEVSYLNGATLRITGNVDPSVLRTLIHLDD